VHPVCRHRVRVAVRYGCRAAVCAASVFELPRFGRCDGISVLRGVCTCCGQRVVVSFPRRTRANLSWGVLIGLLAGTISGVRRFNGCSRRFHWNA